MILAASQRILNRCVAESSTARRMLAALEGTSFGLEVEGTGVSILVSVAGGEARLALADAAHADAVLRAAPIDLLRLAADGSLGGLKATAARLEGRISVAESYAELFRHARPDLEDELAGWVGDVAAHEIGTAARALGAWIDHARRALELDAVEYLRDERAVLVAPLELDRFAAGVEDLRDAVERAEQRVAVVARARAAGR